MSGIGKSLLTAAVLSSAILGMSSGWSAENPEQVIVTGATEEAVAGRVATALSEDPYLYAEHVNVHSKGGVVTLDGMVADVSDLRTALRITGSVSYGRQIANNLELYGDAGNIDE